MDSVMNGLMSNNGWIIALLIAIIAFLIIKSAKAGLFSYKSNKIQIGRDDREIEQIIIRNQFDYAKDMIESLERDIPRFENYSEDRGRFVLEKLFDEVIKWIVLNHIEKTKSYVGIKQKKVLNIIRKYSKNDLYTTDEFNEYVKKQVKDMIYTLVDIREEYNKQNSKES